MIKNILHPKKQRGFIILFAVTLASLLLSIALGIASVAYREVTFSTSAREANDAFLAADTGAECILSNDKQSSALPVTGTPDTIVTINCGADPITVTPDFTTDENTNTNTATYNFTIPNLGPSQNGCASVKLVKTDVAGLETFTVTSKGYNGACGSQGLHSVEREIVVSSVAGAATTPPLVNSVSVSLSSDASSVASGEPVLLSWVTSGVYGCLASGDWSGSKAFGTGSESITMTTSGSKTFVLTCKDSVTDLYTTPASVTVTVTTPSPIVNTGSASLSVSNPDTAATINGTVNPNGYTSTAWFRYATSNATCDGNFGSATASSGPYSGSSSNSYSANLTGLTPGQTYYYCAVSSNNLGVTSYSSIQSFTTQSVCDTSYTANAFHVCYFDGIAAPTTASAILTQGVEASLSSPVTAWSGFTHDWWNGQIENTGKTDSVSAVWRGNINFTNGTYTFHVAADDGVQLIVNGSTLIDKWLDQATTQYDSAPVVLSGAKNVQMRWYENSGGAYSRLWWDYAPLVSAPTVTTSAATNLAKTTATLNGSVNPNNGNTTGWFRYSLTKSNLGTTSCSASSTGSSTGSVIYTGNSSVAMTGGGLTGLTSKKTYYFCAIAQNSAGTSYGTVLNFTTK